jgi:hypothetical protein
MWEFMSGLLATQNSALHFGATGYIICIKSEKHSKTGPTDSFDKFSKGSTLGWLVLLICQGCAFTERRTWDINTIHLAFVWRSSLMLRFSRRVSAIQLRRLGLKGAFIVGKGGGVGHCVGG